MKISDLKDKKIGILGFGVEGLALCNFLMNLQCDITILDLATMDVLKERGKENGELSKILADKRVKFVLGGKYLDKLDDFDILFRSPGVKYLEENIQRAIESGVIVTSQIKLFFDLCPAIIIGVTGTKGKGTTSSLILSMLEAEESKKRENEKRKIYLAGNIGEPAISLIPRIEKQDVVILELSSFQLQDLKKSPNIAVVLNISIDHLDYHKNREEYVKAKEAIVNFQKKEDFAIINQDYLTSFEFASITNAEVFFFSGKNSVDRGAFLRETEDLESGFKTISVILRMDDREEEICSMDEINLLGRHNMENIAAASIAAKVAGAEFDSIRAGSLKFRGLEHRLEKVREKGSVLFVNDSFSTNPDPTIAAIRSFSENKVLIVGGSTKGADFGQMALEIANSNVVGVITIGDEAEKIESALVDNNYDGVLISAKTNFAEAVRGAYELAKKLSAVVLFSPACASFDMFKNYKDRGSKFKKEVEKI